MPWDSCLVDGVATLSCLPIIFKNIINTAILFAGITALVFIIYAGFKYIRSGGDPKQTEGARKTLTYAIFGLLLILLSFFIINFIGFFTGTTCIQQFGFDQCN